MCICHISGLPEVLRTRLENVATGFQWSFCFSGSSRDLFVTELSFDFGMLIDGILLGCLFMALIVETLSFSERVNFDSVVTY